MLKDKIVLVLGAGASMDYGYPSGAQLLDEDIPTLLNGTKIFWRGLNLKPDSDPKRKHPLKILAYFLWYHGLNSNSIRDYIEALKIVHELNVQLHLAAPSSIDDFLARISRSKGEDNDSYLFLGKLILLLIFKAYQNKRVFEPKRISTEQLQSDSHRYLMFPYLERHECYRYERGWYNYLWKEIYEGCFSLDDCLQSLKNLHVITFNYDNSLQNFLYNALSAMYGKVLSKEQFEENTHIHHVYGCVSDGPEDYAPFDLSKVDADLDDFFATNRYTDGMHSIVNIKTGFSQLGMSDDVFNTLEIVCSRVNSLRIYEESGIEAEKELYRGIKRCFFLGFGYADQNLRWLSENLFPVLSDSCQFFGTTFGFELEEYRQWFSKMKKVLFDHYHKKGLDTLNKSSLRKKHISGPYSDQELKEMKNLKIIDFIKTVCGGLQNNG